MKYWVIVRTDKSSTTVYGDRNGVPFDKLVNAQRSLAMRQRQDRVKGAYWETMLVQAR